MQQIKTNLTEEHRLVWLDNSRIISIFAVILLHVSATFVIGKEVGTESWWFGNVYDSLVRWCVPVFVMISGALLLDPNKHDDLRSFYTKRLLRIVIPILFWSFIFSILVYWRSVANGNEITIWDLINRLLSGIPYYHMWFLYMILGLYLFAPFFCRIVVNLSKQEFIFFIAILFILSALNFAYSKSLPGGSGLFINKFLSYVPFFFMGYYIRQDNNFLQEIILWGVFLISFLLTFFCCTFFSIIYGSDFGLYFYGYLSVNVIAMSISIMYLFKGWSKPIFKYSINRKISFLTFGVYCVHPIVLSVFDYNQHAVVVYHPIISIFFLVFSVFVVSLCIAYFFSNIPYLRRTI